MSSKRERIGDLFIRSKAMLEVAMTDDDIKKALVQFNYDETILTEGKKILAEGDQLAKEYIKVAGEKKEVASSVGKMSKDAGKVFSQHIKLSRLAFRKDPEKLDKLKARRLIKGPMTARLFQVEQFYAVAVTDDDLLKKLARYGITQEKLQSAKNLSEQFQRARDSHNQLKGKSQDLRNRRDDAINNVKTWMAEFIQVCRLALQNNPQLLEKLGILVLSRGYHHKKKEAKPETPPAEKKEVAGQV